MELHIPIPQYPPFDLRSSLIDKDPVIWVHLLQGYVDLFQVLVDPPPDLQLAVRSQQQLQYFVKVYLAESATEASRLYSLGAINPDIKTNAATLRSLVFQLIKAYSIVKLNLTGEVVWHLVCSYVAGNATTVRSLVDGTFKSKLNDNKKSGNISSIPSVQGHLEALVKAGKFAHNDLELLAHLLGQSIAASQAQTISISGSSASKKIGQKSNSTQFAEKFVTTSWIDLLETLYSGGTSVHASTIEQIMVLSVVSLSPAKLAKLVISMGIDGPAGLKKLPLFGAILISDSLLRLSPGLKERLPFMGKLEYRTTAENGASALSIKEEDINTLRDLFPQLTLGQAKTLLREQSVELATNMLLEQPESVSNISEHVEEAAESFDSEGPSASSSARFNNSVKSNVLVKKKQQAVSSDELQKKTLSAAIRLMYESDEDEPDDTYDDQETSTQNSERDVRLSRDKGVESRQSVDATSRHLFLVFKLDKEALTRTARKSAARQALKKVTHMSDEQIEGWFRLLLKSPRRFKILEEDFFYGGNPNKRSPSTQGEPGEGGVSEKENESEGQGNGGQSAEKGQKNAGKGMSKEQAQRKQKRDEAQKSSRANHNRKRGHDKKTQGTLAGMKQ